MQTIGFRARCARLRGFVRWRVGALVSATLYRQAVRHVSWWPLALFVRRPRTAATPRIAYYYHAFPILSETFIQREVAALRQAGIAVDVFAHGTDGAEHFGDQAKRLMATTTYIPAMGSTGFPTSLRGFVRRHPLRVANLFLYIVFRQHRPRKTYGRDRQLFSQVITLADALEAKSVTHVHCPWASPDATIAMCAAVLLGVRYTVQARASDIHRNTSVFGRQERLSHAAFVITNTRYNESILRGLLAGREQAIHVIYNGIDVRLFHPAPRRTAPGAPPRILCVGRLTAPKGLEYLLVACARLRDEGRAVRCEIVGGRVANEVNYYLELKKLRRDLDLEAHIDFVGAQPFDYVQARYADTDVFVLPAVMAPDGRREVIPNVLIEAMAMQLPVVSTTMGAIPEIIEDGVSGLLVSPRDAHALAAAITRVLNDAALCASLGANARKRVAERFDINKNVRSYVALFAAAER